MKLKELLESKEIKSKQKTEKLCAYILTKQILLDEVIKTASQIKDSDKATCIEAVEYASKKKPESVTPKMFEFVSESLTSTAPRVKWESAKVIGNTAHLFAGKLDTAIVNLLSNSEHSGTVVRWSAAFALGEIIKLRTRYNTELVPAIESILLREEKNSIKKIYLAALKNLPPNK